MGIAVSPMVSLAQAEEAGSKFVTALGGGSIDALRAKSAQEVLKAWVSVQPLENGVDLQHS